MAKTEEFMFQNVAYRPTVYITGTLSITFEFITKSTEFLFAPFLAEAKHNTIKMSF